MSQETIFDELNFSEYPKEGRVDQGMRVAEALHSYIDMVQARFDFIRGGECGEIQHKLTGTLFNQEIVAPIGPQRDLSALIHYWDHLNDTKPGTLNNEDIQLHQLFVARLKMEARAIQKRCVDLVSNEITSPVKQVIQQELSNSFRPQIKKP